MTRVFITGASGFLGRHLARALCSAGYDVVALVRSPSPSLGDLTGELKTIVLPNPNLRELSNALGDGFDVVCHLAAFLPKNHLDPSFARLCLESNVVLTLNLLQASLCNGVERFLYFSAGNAYSHDSDRPARETDPVYPSRISPFYLGSKMLAEIFVEHYRQQYSLDTVSLRISSPYGIGMPAKSVIMSFIHRTLEGLPLQVYGDGRHKTDLVYVGDVIDVSMAAIHGGLPGVYNVGSGVATSILELADVVSEVFERNAPIQFIPAKPGWRGGFRPLGIGKARNMWNWNPRSLKDGLRAMRAAMEYEQQ